MAVNPNEDTEFNDALRKHGILPPKAAPPWTPTPPPSPTLSESLQNASDRELDELLDDVQNSDTERALEKIRDRRLNELRTEQRRARFDSVYPISREDYTQEVTDASKVNEVDEEGSGKGTGVVCILYKDGQIASTRLLDHARNLASRYTRTKFVSIIGNKCIADYPDRNVPTVFVYRAGNLRHTEVAWGASKERVLEEFEALLLLTGAIAPPDRFNKPGSVRRGNQDNDSKDERPSTRIRGPSNQKSRVNDDLDSDFDL